MSKLLFMDGFAMLKLWAVGFFGFHVNGIIHILPVIAFLALLLGILCNKLLIRKNILKKTKS
jgi:Family of unknown function (DUF5670)